MTRAQRRARGRAQAQQASALKPASASGPFKIDPVLKGLAKTGRRKPVPVEPFAAAQHPPAVTGDRKLAMDEAPGVGAWAATAIGGYTGACGFFPGFAQLALQAQIPEVRRMVEIIASEATRAWIKIQAAGEDKAEKVKKIEKAFDAFKVRDLFRRVLEGDGYFGRGHLYIDLGEAMPDELATSIGDGTDATSRGKVNRGSLKGFRIVEAMWSYPQGYNTTDPLAADWYKPTAWLVQGRTVHRTRLLTFVGREVPDLLKPAYSFGGLSLSQIAKPTIDNWLGTRESVSDLISAFSVMVFATRAANELGVMSPAVNDRAELFNDFRDNRGLMILDKDSEALTNVSAPLGTLDALQAQAQEHMASVSGIPLVKLFGISPHGLNASSDGEIRVFYDTVHAYAELGRPLLTAVLGFVQLHLFGEVDPEITFAFEPLWSMSDKEQADVRYVEAQTAQAYVDSGVILPDEERKRLADDPESTYHGLDLTVDIAPPPGEEDRLPEVPAPEAETTEETGEPDREAA